MRALNRLRLSGEQHMPLTAGPPPLFRQSGTVVLFTLFDACLPLEGSPECPRPRLLRRDGEGAIQDLREQGNADPHAGPGRGRQDHDPVQVEAGPVGDHHSHGGFQRGDGDLQKRQVQRVGRGRPGQDPAALATLLHRDPGSDLRGGLRRPRPHRRGPPGAAPYYQ